MLLFQDKSVYSVPVILVGNKNDLWHDREVGTDQACQEAEAAGFSNYFEITVRDSLDQVRVVFHEGIRRGLACGEHRRGPGRRIMRSFSTERDLRENSLEYEDEAGISSKATVNLPSHIICHIKRKLTSKISEDFLQCGKKQFQVQKLLSRNNIRRSVWQTPTTHIPLLQKTHSVAQFF